MIYEIAEKRIDIQNKYAFTTKYCREYLSNDQTSPADIIVSATEEEIALERTHKSSTSDGYVENIVLYRKICEQLTAFDRFIFHASAVTVGTSAYLFTGRSGSGKSTHSRLWLEYVSGAEILNGDKPIISLEADKLYVHGTPWNGKEGMGKKGKAEIKAITFIVQAPENRIQPYPKSKLSSALIKQMLIPRTEWGVSKTLEFADKLASLPVYELECTISEEAVSIAKKMLVKDV